MTNAFLPLVNYPNGIFIMAVLGFGMRWIGSNSSDFYVWRKEEAKLNNHNPVWYQNYFLLYLLV